MKILMLLLAVASLACDNPWRFVYENGTPLAIHQDSLISQYNRGDTTISKYDLRTLKINEWVRVACEVAPGNLVIRQYCLIDLLGHKPEHRQQITRMVNLLSGGSGPLRTWCESYTYWLYVKVILYPWLKHFPDTDLSQMTQEIEMGFASTSYLRGIVWYPAVFGDLWDEPLDSAGQVLALQYCHTGDSITVKNIHRQQVATNTIVYDIQPMPMGLNGHPDISKNSYTVIDGVPINFQFYLGYDKKYPTEKAEWTSLLNPIRLLTIPFTW